MYREKGKDSFIINLFLDENSHRHSKNHHYNRHDDNEKDQRNKKDKLSKISDKDEDDFDIMRHHAEYANSNIENMIARIIPAVVKSVSKQNEHLQTSSKEVNLHGTLTKRNLIATPKPTIRPSKTHRHTTTRHTTPKNHRTPPHPSKRPTHSMSKAHHTTPANLNMILKGLKALGISPNNLNKKTPTKAAVVLNPSTTPTTPHVVNLHDPSKIRILCFGDSLTAGYNSHGKNYYPYCSRLQKVLNYRSSIPVYTETKGVVGEMTHKQMTSRLPLVLGNTTYDYDWILILGGTNDILHVKNFADDQEFLNQLENVWQPRITKDIEKLHDIAYKFGAHTMLLTVPENAIEAWPDYKPLLKMRQRINESLRKFAAASKGKTVLCDIAKKMPRHSLGPLQEAAVWDDHLHMTPEGYTKMAGLVADCIKPYLPHPNGW